jgi:hypothetical protein
VRRVRGGVQSNGGWRMTKDRYRDYEAGVKAFFERNDLKSLNP